MPFPVLMRTDEPGKRRAERQWHGMDDNFLVAVFHMIGTLERYGPERDQCCETLDGRYDTYALCPQAGDARRMLFTHDRESDELTFLGFSVSNPGCNDAYDEAIAAHGLTAPSREPRT